MKKSSLKYVAVCAVALTTVAAASPAVGIFVGQDAVVAEAAVADNAVVAVGGFTDYDLSVINSSANKLPGSNVADNTGIIGSVTGNVKPGVLRNILLNNGAYAGTDKVVDALGGEIKAQATGSSKVIVTLTQGGTAITGNLNSLKAGTYDLTFQLEVGGNPVAGVTRTVKLKVAGSTVTAAALTKELSNEYDALAGLTITDPNGKVLDLTTGPNNDRDRVRVTEVADGSTFAVANNTVTVGTGTNAKYYFNKLSNGKVQKIKVEVETGGIWADAGTYSRTVTVNANGETTPILAVGTGTATLLTAPGRDLVFTDGQTVPAAYAPSIGTRLIQPSDKNAALKSELFGTTNVIQLEGETTTNVNPLSLHALGGYVNTLAGNFFKEQVAIANISVDGSLVDFTKAGSYTAKVTLTSVSGATSTITVPITVGESEKGPAYIFFNGVTRDQTIKVGEGFNAKTGVIFFENKTEAQVANNKGVQIPEERISIKSNVNTNVAGVYTVTYTATNTLGKTLSLTRTITVTADDAKAPVVSYSAHVQNRGWGSAVTSGATAGTTGKALRVEAIKLSLSNLAAAGTTGGITYQTHVQSYGWNQGWVSDGAIAGTTGQSKRVEALRIKLTGAVADTYNVQYRAHVQGKGWMKWVSNGEIAGTTGQSRRVEAIQVKLVKK